MATIETTVDIDLDEFENQEIINEVEYRLDDSNHRKFSKEEKDELMDLLIKEPDTSTFLPSNHASNLADLEKWKLIEEYFDKYNYSELEQMFKNNSK